MREGINNSTKVNGAKVRKALPKVNKLSNKAWEKKGGIDGTHACSAGCQQTMQNTCHC